MNASRRAAWLPALMALQCLMAVARAEEVAAAGEVRVPALAAEASQVVIYGTIDIYGDYTRAHDTSLVRVDSGGLNACKMGYKESDTLGSLRGTLQLESGFSIDPQKPTVLFNRQSSYTVASPWGSMSYGRQYTLHTRLLGGEIDPFATSFNATLFYVFHTSTTLFRRDNMGIYETPRWGGVGAAVSVASDGFNAGRGVRDQIIQLDYRDDQIYVGAVHVDEHRQGASASERIDLLGGHFQVARFIAHAGVQVVKDVDASEFVELALGGEGRLSNGDRILFSWARSTEQHAGQHGGDVEGLSWVRDLTSRFAIYAGVARLANRRASNVDLGIPVRPGGVTRDVMGGARLRF